MFYADVTCGGLEGRLADCDKGEIEETNCGHNQDAGVQCLPGMWDNLKWSGSKGLTSWTCANSTTGNIFLPEYSVNPFLIFYSRC